jgi:hypothetical protein
LRIVDVDLGGLSAAGRARTDGDAGRPEREWRRSARRKPGWRGCDLLCSASFGVPVLKVSWLIRLAQVAFFAAFIFTFYSAVIPPQKALQLVPWDKAEHFLAFYALTGLGVAGFPRRNLFVLAALLSAFGAFIEFVQGLPIVHRDRDFWDWLADTVAIAMALAPMILVWWRRVVRSGQKNIDI